MKEVNKIWDTKECYGCSMCSIVCRPNVISIGLNSKGFYEPQITAPDKCTDCGLCFEVCAYNHKERSLKDVEIKSWAGWSNDANIRQKCSSGGIGFEIGRYLIQHGYKAVGCRYNVEKCIAEHYIAQSVEEFDDSIGSKYIQSYTEEAFRQIVRRGEKYFITGTPCQIDSFRRMIQKFHCEDDFVLLDFFCHGVPSHLMWDKYIKTAKSKVGKINHVTWRDKTHGWHDSWNMKVSGTTGNEYSCRWTQHDMFYDLFLGNACLGPQCYDACKYKCNQSSADIRIGDLWGNRYQNNQEGVSAVITFTEKGRQVVKSIGCTLVEHDLDVVGEGQVTESVRRPHEYTKVMKGLLDDSLSIEDVYQIMLRDQQMRRMMRVLCNPLGIIKRYCRR